ncbi:trace amine associated receptor 12f [Pimephales promelas]|nr:trace amine associated receptor 12f [Pimephales promelas]
MTSNETDSENMFLCYPLLPDSCPKVHRLTVVKVAMYVFMVLMILTTVFGNLLIIISISHFKHLKSPTHLIVRSLAACDCLLGSLVMPYSMVRSVEGCCSAELRIIHTRLVQDHSEHSYRHLKICMPSVSLYDRFLYKVGVEVRPLTRETTSAGRKAQTHSLIVKQQNSSDTANDRLRSRRQLARTSTSVFIPALRGGLCYVITYGNSHWLFQYSKMISSLV